MVKIFTTSRYKVNKKKLSQFAEAYLQRNNVDKNFLVNIIFIGTRKMRLIATEYKNENEALPVLAFAYDFKTQQEALENDFELLGEVFICYPQVVLLAAEKEKTVYETITWLIEHGIENIIKN